MTYFDQMSGKIRLRVSSVEILVDKCDVQEIQKALQGEITGTKFRYKPNPKGGVLRLRKATVVVSIGQAEKLAEQVALAEKEVDAALEITDPEFLQQIAEAEMEVEQSLRACDEVEKNDEGAA